MTGSQVEKPRYYRTIAGASISNITAENYIKDGSNGLLAVMYLPVLKFLLTNYIGFYDSQIAVIVEGNEQEFLGWIAPGLQNSQCLSRIFRG